MSKFKKQFINFLVRALVRADNLIYKVISRLVVLVNNGVHPKHDILNYHQFFIDNISSSDTVLDVGCGKGMVAFDVAVKAREVIGIDISVANIDWAQTHYVKENLKFVVGDATDYNFGNRFDKIILSNVLEHIDKRVDFLNKLHGVSDTVLLRVPLIERDWLTMYKQKNGLEYRLDSTHFIEYTVVGLAHELEQAGWKVESYNVKFGEWWGVVVPFFV